MFRAAVALICVLVVAPVWAEVDATSSPVAQTEPAQVVIDPQPDGRRLLRLPSLEFPLRVAPVCPTDLEFRSLLVSIADTRKSFEAADFAADPIIETRIRISHQQISPIAVDQFCNGEDNGSPTLIIADAFTANVSLRCGNDAQESVSYDSVALEILLVCRLPEPTDAAASAAADPSGSSDQDASSGERF